MNVTRQPRSLQPLAEPLIDRWFDRLFAMPEWSADLTTPTGWLPPVDLSETPSEYVMKLDAPGFHKENLDINLDGNVLTLSGRRETKKEEETIGYLYRERQEGKFVRSIRMPEAVDAAKVTAAYQDGILTVRVAKANPRVATRIPIK